MFTPTATTVSVFKKNPTAGPTVKMSVFGWTGVQEEWLLISSNITLMSRTLRWGGTGRWGGLWGPRCFFLQLPSWAAPCGCDWARSEEWSVVRNTRWHKGIKEESQGSLRNCPLPKAVMTVWQIPLCFKLGFTLDESPTLPSRYENEAHRFTPPSCSDCHGDRSRDCPANEGKESACISCAYTSAEMTLKDFSLQGEWAPFLTAVGRQGAIMTLFPTACLPHNNQILRIYTHYVDWIIG